MRVQEDAFEHAQPIEVKYLGFRFRLLGRDLSVYHNSWLDKKLLDSYIAEVDRVKPALQRQLDKPEDSRDLRTGCVVMFRYVVTELAWKFDLRKHCTKAVPGGHITCDFAEELTASRERFIEAVQSKAVTESTKPPVWFILLEGAKRAWFDEDFCPLLNAEEPD